MIICTLRFVFSYSKNSKNFQPDFFWLVGLLTASPLSKKPIHHHSFYLPTLNPTGEVFFSFFFPTPYFVLPPYFSVCKGLVFFSNLQIIRENNLKFFSKSRPHFHSLYRGAWQPVKPFQSVNSSCFLSTSETRLASFVLGVQRCNLFS